MAREGITAIGAVRAKTGFSEDMSTVWDGRILGARDETEGKSKGHVR